MTETEYTDPPNMPESERMRPAEFRVVRESLGLTGKWLADYLNVNPRTVRGWEQGRNAIPDGVRLAIEELEQATDRFVAKAVQHLRDAPSPGIVTYRSDAEYHAVHPESPWPASWNRAACARVALEVPGLAIAYPDDARREERTGKITPGL